MATEPNPNKTARSSKPLWRRIFGSVWFNLFAAILVVALVQSFVVKLYAVPSSSMEQTLETGDRILANRLAFVAGNPERGDVVVFNSGSTWAPRAPSSDSALETSVKWLGGLFGIGPGTEHTLVKRVVAVGGETVSCCNSSGSVLVNGVALTEPYISDDLPFIPGTLDCTTEAVSDRCFPPFTVPRNQFVVLGDHRSNSADSMADCRGKTSPGECTVATVRRSDLVGKVFAIVWPIPRWGGVG